MNGRMAYAILCVEKYLKEKYPDDAWNELSKLMWSVTSIYWDEWDNKFIEIIPNTYSNSARMLNLILKRFPRMNITHLLHC